jgi:glyoxylase-like metal-dependent hydrolase (beta-lactamase superfamily II)
MFQVHFRSETGTYSYLIATDRGHEALVVDPTEDCLESYAQLCDRLGYRLRYVLETGVVAESAKAAFALEDQWGCRRVVPCDAFRVGDVVRVGHADRLQLAGLTLDVIGRPGCVQRSVAYAIEDRVFIGSGEVRGDPRLRQLPADTLIYRAIPRRGTNLGLLGLELGSSWRDRALFRAKRRPGEPVVQPIRGLA